MRWHRSKSLLLLSVALCVTALAVAADKPKRIKYVPPAGFAGHKWGDPLSSFPRLPAQPLDVGSAWIGPVLVDQRYNCIGICDPGRALIYLQETREGGGFYVLSEYEIEGQGFQWDDDARVQFFPVTYQFCANWWSRKKVKPANFDEINEFCGVKLRFETETRDQLRALPADYETNYDRVLGMLLARFGRPDNFVRRGRVVIETTEADPFNDVAERTFRTYRWCPAFDRRLHTPCTASVVLTMDPASGAGMVLYSAPLLWEYAYARQYTSFKGEPLFKVLHARK